MPKRSSVGKFVRSDTHIKDADGIARTCVVCTSAIDTGSEWFDHESGAMHEECSHKANPNI